MNCEICGNDKPTESTSFTGNYCLDCMILVRSEISEAIKKLRGKVVKPQKEVVPEKKLTEALDRLLHQ